MLIARALLFRDTLTDDSVLGGIPVRLIIFQEIAPRFDVVSVDRRNCSISHF